MPSLLFAHTDYARLPTHAFANPTDLGTANRGLWQLLGGVGAVYLLGVARLRGRAVAPR